MSMNPDDPWWDDAARQEHANGHERPSDRSGPGPGAAVEEAGRLFAAVRDRLLSDPNLMRAGMQALEVFSSLRGSVRNPVAPGEAPECAYCPLCQAIARAQHLNPEAVEVVTEAAVQFADSVRDALGEEQPEQPEPTVRHVPMDDDPEPADPEPADPEPEEIRDADEDN